jgi:hypothetical protein
MSFQQTMSLRDRFDQYVDKNGPSLPSMATRCWIWTGFKQAGGYGYFKIGKRNYAAHRLMLEFRKKRLPPGKLVMHRCDNPACVRPAHLRLGSHRDNTLDAVKKGRWVQRGMKGEKHGRAKLREVQVRHMRIWAAGGTPLNELAGKFSVSLRHVRKIVSRQVWGHL